MDRGLSDAYFSVQLLVVRSALVRIYVGRIQQDLRPAAIKRKGYMDQLSKGALDGALQVRRDVKQHKPASASPQKLAANRAGSDGPIINIVDT